MALTVPVEIIKVLTPEKIVIRYTTPYLKERVEKLELEILRSMKDRKLPNPDDNVFKINEHVAVVCDDFDKPRRGIIIEIHQSSSSEDVPLYGIFLYDYGEFRGYDLSLIKHLNSNFTTDLAPCSLMVTIPGIVPSQLIRRSSGCVGSKQGSLCVPAQEWSAECINFVQEWVQKRPVQLRKIATRDDVSICGDFYQDGVEEPLSRRLFLEKFALYEETHYRKLISEEVKNSQLSSAVSLGNVSSVDVLPVNPDSTMLQLNSNDPIISNESVVTTSYSSSNKQTRVSCGRGKTQTTFLKQEDSSHTPISSGRGRRITTNKFLDNDDRPSCSLPGVLDQFASGDNTSIVSKSTANQEEVFVVAGGLGTNSIKEVNKSVIVPANQVNIDLQKKEAMANIPIPVSGIKAKFAKFRISDIEYSEEVNSLLLDEVESNSKKVYPDSIIPAPSIKVFLRGKNTVSPYNQIENFPLQGLVAKTLECDLQISQINSLQRCSWPHVLRGRNCFIIGGQSGKKGKSLSYIVPIAASILSELENAKQAVKGEKTTRVGPIGLFVCSSLYSGEKLKEHMEHLLGRSKIGVYLTIAASADIKYKLKDNPEFIITTPEFVLTLLENYYSLFGFERLRYMVFDDAHLLLKLKLEAVTNIIGRLSHYLTKIEKRPFSLQTIFCGQEWNKEMEAAFLRVPFEPVLIIGSSFQAIAYAGIKIRIHFVIMDEKMDKLIELIENEVQTRTVVLCQEQKTVVEIGLKLYRTKGVRTVFLPAGCVTSDQINGMKNDWLNSNAKDRVFFICTDSDLRELNLHDVENIIHFEMPITKSETFGDRHIGMWNLFPDISKAVNETMPSSEQELTSHVFLTPDEKDLHKIVRYFKRINVEIPEDLEHLTQITSNEEAKKSLLCDTLKRFGMCSKHDKLHCDNRHFFNPDETSGEPTVPKTGRIEVEIVNCNTVNTYIAKLHHYYELKNGRKIGHISFLNILKKREEDLTTYYSQESNRVPVLNLKKKSMCALLPNEGINFTRGRIETIIQVSDPGFPLKVRVFCVDTGHYAVRTVKEIYALPEEFVLAKPTCVDVILADLKPVCGEEQFKIQDNIKARKLTEGQIYTGRIALSIGNTVWVKPMVEHKKDLCGDWVQRTNVRLELTKKLNVAEENHGHLECLYHLCELAGFNCDIYRTTDFIGREFEETFYFFGEPLRWSYLNTSSMSNPKTSEVWSTYAESPDLIYVNLNKFVNLLDDLNNDLEHQVLSLIEGQYPDYSSRFYNYYEEGMCVAAKERSEKMWNRAIITNIREDTEDGSKLFDIFFADHGDSSFGMSSFELFPIPKKLVNRLPFQAIGLRLNHIYQGKLVENENTVTGEMPKWDNSVDGVLKKILFKEEKSKCLDILVLEKLSKSNGNIPPCEYYEAFIFVDDKELGEYLVEENYAKYYPGMEDCVKQVKKDILDDLNSIVDSKLTTDLNEDEDYENSDPCSTIIDSVNMDDFDVYLGDGPNGFINHFLPEFAKKNGTTRLPPIDEPQPSTSHSLRAQLDAHSSPGISTSNPVPCSSQSFTTKNRPTGQQQPYNPESNGYDKVQKTIPKTSTSFPNEDGLTKPQCSDISESIVYMKKPRVEWYQTSSTVYLRILITDLKKYSLKIGEDKRNLSFNSEEPSNYGFELNLFGKICLPPEEIPHGQCLLIKMTKLSEGRKWDNITNEKTNFKWLKHDLNNLDDSADSEDISDSDYAGDDFQRGAKMTKNEEAKDIKSNYSGMLVDFEGDDDNEDSFSSDSDISDDREGSADIYK